MPLLRTIAEKLKASGGTLKYSAKLQSCASHNFSLALSSTPLSFQTQRAVVLQQPQTAYIVPTPGGPVSATFICLSKQKLKRATATHASRVHTARAVQLLQPNYSCQHKLAKAQQH
eukprot:3539-Heterococcus_DN1.PRE.2